MSLHPRSLLRLAVAAAALIGSGAPGLAVTGDLDGSGLVDGWDLIQIAQAFGAAPGGAAWSAGADFDGNAIIDGSDLAVLVANFGRRAETTATDAGLGRIGRALYRTDQIVVKFVPEMGTEAVKERTASLGGTVRTVTPHFVTVAVDTATGDSVAAAVARFSRDPQVVYAEPDGIAYALYRPNDPLYPAQWHFADVAYETALDVNTGAAPSVIVAVIDTGVAYEDYGPYRKAPDFAGTAFLPGPDIIDRDGHPNDAATDFGHGTFCAGIIAATTNNGYGTAGIAFHATLMPIRVLGANGEGTYAGVAEGIDAAVAGGARILNLSVGGLATSITLQEAVRRAHAAGATMVAAAGNEADDPEYTPDWVFIPAAYPEVIAVGATDGARGRSYYSSYAPWLDMAAPGGDVTRDRDGDGNPDGVLAQTFRKGQFANFEFIFAQGTSFAAPHVAGAAALLYARGVTHPEAIRNMLTLTADDAGPAGFDQEFGSGILNMRRALEGLGPD